MRYRSPIMDREAAPVAQFFLREMYQLTASTSRICHGVSKPQSATKRGKLWSLCRKKTGFSIERNQK